MLDLDHYTIALEYEDMGDVTNPHVISFQVPGEALFRIQDVLPGQLKKLAYHNNLCVGRVELLNRDVAATFGLQRYGDWLRTNVGQANDDWMLYGIGGLEGSWVRIRFATQEQAMLFKLTFHNQ